MEAAGFQQGDVSCQGGGVAADVDQALGGHAGDGFDGVGVQALAGGIHGDHVRADARFLQAQGGLSGVGAEEFGVFNAVAPGVVPGVLHRLGDDLHPQHLSGRGGHGQGDGAHAAVQIQHQVVLCDAGQGNGGPVEPLGLVVVHLVKGAGGQAEIQAAQGILNKAGAIEGDEFVAQDGVALFGVHAEHQGRKARDPLEPLHQLRHAGELSPVDCQAHQNLPGDLSPADVDVPQQAGVGGLVVDRDAAAVDVIDHGILYLIRLLGEDQAAGIFHHVVGARPEKPGVGPALLAGHRVLGLVAVAAAVRRGQDGDAFQLLPCQPVQAGLHPGRLQAALLRVVHVPEVAAAAELGHRAGPVDPVGGFFQKLGDLPRRPGLAHHLDAHPHPLAHNGVGNKYSDPLNVRNSLPLGSIVRDHGLVNRILFQHSNSPCK